MPLPIWTPTRRWLAGMGIDPPLVRIVPFCPAEASWAENQIVFLPRLRIKIMPPVIGFFLSPFFTFRTKRLTPVLVNTFLANGLFQYFSGGIFQGSCLLILSGIRLFFPKHSLTVQGSTLSVPLHILCTFPTPVMHDKRKRGCSALICIYSDQDVLSTPSQLQDHS